MKKNYFILALIISIFTQYFYAQTTAIPDANFEQALIDLGIDSDGDVNQNVLTSDISGVTFLFVNNKNITDLTGIEGFTALTLLNCNDNQLTSLDVSQNTALESLICQNNLLTSLDVSHNTALSDLSFSFNQLTSIDVIINTALTGLNCQYNQLMSLDVSQNTALNNLACDNNSLTSLNVKNGNNPNFTFFYAQNNPSLSCIAVDNSNDANAGNGVYANWLKDAAATYSEDCTQTTAIPDANFEQALIDLGIDSDGIINQSVLTSDIASVNSLDVSNKNIADLTGIEEFKALTYLI